MNSSLHQIVSNIKQIYTGNCENNKKYVLTLGTIGAIFIGLYSGFYFKNKRRYLNKLATIVDSIPELKQSNVKIKNIDNVERILLRMIKDGKQRLQVISDFDRTISDYERNGQKCNTSFATLEKSKFVNPETKLKFDALREKYLPIEIDSQLTKNEKIPSMVEWWTKSLNLVVSTNIHRDNIAKMVENSNTVLRDGCNLFFHTLEKHDIPIMIFSAGIGNIVQEFILQHCSYNFKNMRIVSNFMKFNNITNRICGFQGKLIHTFNKSESVLLDIDYEKLIENRNNVILIGDSLGDTNMADGIRSINNELKIGYLNEHVEKSLPTYMDNFDIVIIKDSTFDVPNAIIRLLIQ